MSLEKHGTANISCFDSGDFVSWNLFLLYKLTKLLGS